MKFLSGLTFVSSVLTIYYEYFDRRFVYFFKPLTLVLIILIAWFYGAKSKFYRAAILAGLFFSLVGDTFLINPQNFVFGLASFLVAHLCYVSAFAAASEKKFKLLSLIALSVGAAIFSLNYSNVPANLKIPVAVYALAISAMLAAALNFYLTKKKTPQAIFALSGAFLFVVSDSLLAFNKFSGAFLLAKLAVLITYFLAQWLIVRSV